MGKYIDEYLIALGYDLDDKNAQKFLKIQDEIEKRNKELGVSDKSTLKQEQKHSEAQKKRIKDTKDEIDSTDKLRKANEELNKSKQKGSEGKKPQKAAGSPPSKPPKRPHTTTAEPPPTPSHKPKAPASSHERKSRKRREAPAQEQTTKQESTQKRATPHKKQSTTSKKPDVDVNIENLNNLKKSFSDLERAWVNAKNGNFISAIMQGASGAKHFNSYMDNLSGSFDKTNKKAGGFKKTLSSIFGDKAAAEGADDTIADIGEVAGVSKFGVLGAAAGITTGIALMTKAVWGMSNGFANANTNIETMARELWITDSAAYGLNSTLSAMGKTTAGLNEIALNPTLNKQFKEIQKHTSQYNTQNESKAAEDWAKDVQTPAYEFKADMGQIGATIQANIAELNKGMFSGLFKGLDKGTDFILNALGGKKSDSASAYAPQNSYYNSNYAEGAKITVAPNIAITAKSENAQDVGQAAYDGVNQALNSSALIRNTRGLER